MRGARAKQIRRLVRALRKRGHLAEKGPDAWYRRWYKAMWNSTPYPIRGRLSDGINRSIGA